MVATLEIPTKPLILSPDKDRQEGYMKCKETWLCLDLLTTSAPPFHCEKQDLLKYSRKLAYWQCPDIFLDGIAFFAWINNPCPLRVYFIDSIR